MQSSLVLSSDWERGEESCGARCAAERELTEQLALQRAVQVPEELCSPGEYARGESAELVLSTSTRLDVVVRRSAQPQRAYRKNNEHFQPKACLSSSVSCEFETI